VLPQPLAAVVQDATGAPVGVSARLELTGSPSRLFVGALDVSGGRRDMADAGLGAFGGGREVFGDGRDAMEITGWAGPWPIDERWWAPAEARRRARFQIGLADGRAMLLFLAAGHWAVEAIYD
jgi:protein ImuB